MTDRERERQEWFELGSVGSQPVEGTDSWRLLSPESEGTPFPQSGGWRRWTELEIVTMKNGCEC